MYETGEEKQRALLIGADQGKYDAEVSISELAELAETAGVEVVSNVLQKMQSIHNATYIGTGKLQEIKEFCKRQDIDLLIFDDELSGIQIRNIEESTGIDTVDRTMLILDIFAHRAKSNEGKLQVELAQQKYLLPRLIGMGNKLSRQGGGIGSRGPGETKLESDRRHIHRRIAALEQELSELKQRREQIRRRREKNDVISIALVGYTNVGKSTLLNLLTNSEVYVKNQLFATLDPTAREIVLPSGQSAVVVDTVGLIRRLPHQLVEAFHSTLEEAASADVILNICDISINDAQEQLEVTRSVLDELGCGDIPVITVCNKVDLTEDKMMSFGENTVFISAKNKKGIDRLLQTICKVLSERVEEVELLLPYSEGSLLEQIHRNGKMLEEEYRPDGVRIKIVIDKKLLKAVLPFKAE